MIKKTHFIIIYTVILVLACSGKLAAINPSDTARILQLLKSSHYQEVVLRNIAIANAQKAYMLSAQNNFYEGIYKSYCQLGFIEYYYNARYDKGLNYYLKALKIAEQQGAKEDQINALIRIGSIYIQQGSFDYASAYLTKANYEANKISNDDLISLSQAQFGLLCESRGFNKKANDYFLTALNHLSETKHPDEYGWLLMALGDNYRYRNSFVIARRYYDKALDIFEANRNLLLKAYTLARLAQVENKIGNHNEALVAVKYALEIAQKNSFLKEQKDCYEVLANIYASQQKYTDAYFSFQKYAQLKDSIFSVERQQKIAHASSKEEIEQRESEINILSEQTEHYKREKNIILLALAIATLAILGLAYFIYTIRKINKELNVKNAIIEQQKLLVINKNKEVIDSINYAQRIQKATLPTQEELNKLIEKNFVLFKPKDIVSGDFYWIAQQQDLSFIAVADCTGHGVPGGFMAMLGTAILNEIVNEQKIIQPAEILNNLREKIIAALKQTGASGENKDGMDIVLCSYDKQKGVLTYAGANNDLYILRNNYETLDDPELIKLKADKMPIGMHINDVKPYIQQSIRLNEGDCVYLFTDGYLDQFGGVRGKKFKYARFENLLRKLINMPIQEQYDIFLEAHDKWKGILDQVDDVLIIGFEA